MCEPLEDPENGEVSVTTRTIDSVANYTCNPGYALVGNDMRTCLETGIWSGEEPTCTSKYYDSQIMGVIMWCGTLVFLPTGLLVPNMIHIISSSHSHSLSLALNTKANGVVIFAYCGYSLYQTGIVK